MGKNFFLSGIIYIFSFLVTFSQEIPQIYKEPKEMMRTTWVASVENLHYPKKMNGKTRNTLPELKEDWLEILNKHEELNFNTVIFQVSPTLDTLYYSKHRPWSHVISGIQGIAPDWAKNFDLLGWMIDETHRRGMEFHAWFNPYRVTHKSLGDGTFKGELSKLSKNNFAKKNPELVYIFDKKLYLDPGQEKTRQHVADVVVEFLEKYDVDAIHFDDYFYPYKVTRDGKTLHFGDKNEDLKTFQKNRRGFKENEIKEWRRDNNDLMVKQIKNVIDAHNIKYRRAVQWGISPFGIWEHENDNPSGSQTPITSTSSNRDIYADTKKWIRNEKIDYIIPQIYWEFTQNAAPYGKLVEWWSGVSEGRRTHLYIGHGNYKHMMSASRVKAWADPEEIGKQLKFNTKYENIKGSAFFGYNSLLKNDKPGNNPGAIAQNRHIDILKKYYFTKKVLVPGKPWLDKEKTQNLKNVKKEKISQGTLITFNDSLKNDTRFYVLYSGDEIIKVVGRDKKNINQRIIITEKELNGRRVTAVAIKDRAGIESRKTSVLK
ncbi:MAG: glycoside hydrolase family 10 protein [Fusobacteriaceae bacterium]